MRAGPSPESKEDRKDRLLRSRSTHEEVQRNLPDGIDMAVVDRSEGVVIPARDAGEQVEVAEIIESRVIPERDSRSR